MAALAIDFKTLLEGVPKGAWVAISSDETRVVSFGSDMRDVIDEARRLGEKDPIVIRVPEGAVALVL